MSNNLYMISNNKKNDRRTTGKILLIDDDPLVRYFISEALEEFSTSVITAKDQEDSLCAISTIKFDLIFVDLHFPSGEYNGFDIIDMIKQHQGKCPIVVITASPDLDTAIQALRIGVYDFIKKPLKPDVLRSIVKKVLLEKSPFFCAIKENSNNSSLLSAHPLTQREKEILTLFAKGFSHSETAQHLGCKTSTVQWHSKKIYRKLGVHSRTQAIHEASCLKIINCFHE